MIIKVGGLEPLGPIGVYAYGAAATVSVGQTDRGRTPDTCIDAAAHAAHGGSAGAVI